MPRLDPLLYAVTLPTLYAAHTLADHVLQTDHQAGNKAAADLRRWVPALAGHVASYQAAQAAALAAVLPTCGLRPHSVGLLTGTALSAASHALLDRRWPVVRVLRATGSPEFADAATARRELPIAPPSHRQRATLDGMETVDRKTVHAVLPAAPVPLHGPYLADQALHTAFLAVTAALIACRARS